LLNFCSKATKNDCAKSTKTLSEKGTLVISTFVQNCQNWGDMSEARVSPAIAADNKRLAWIQSQWRLFQEEEKADRVTGEIMERLLASLILVNVRRPDVYTVWSGCIRRAVEE
jgi:hypothetical protein